MSDSDKQTVSEEMGRLAIAFSRVAEDVQQAVYKACVREGVVDAQVTEMEFMGLLGKAGVGGFLNSVFQEAGRTVMRAPVQEGE